MPEQLEGEGEEKERQKRGRREAWRWNSDHRDSVARCKKSRASKAKNSQCLDSETSITCGSSRSWPLFIMTHFHGINIVFIKVLNMTTRPMIRKSCMTWNKADDSSQSSLKQF